MPSLVCLQITKKGNTNMTLSTEYEFGSYRFAKDMVFGWSISFNYSAYLPIENFNDDVLNMIEMEIYPAYVPAGFQEAIRAELQKRKPSSEASQIASPVVPKEEPELLTKLKSLQLEHSRQRDRITLMTEMLNKATKREEGDGVVIDLDYAKVIHGGKTQPPWVLVGVNGIPMAEGYATIEEVVDRILARWW